jgi:hypothetical protein
VLGLVVAWSSSLASAAPDPYREAIWRAHAAMNKQAWAEAQAAFEEAKAETGEPPEGGTKSALLAIEQGNLEILRKQPRASVAFFRQAAALSLDALWLRRRAFDRRIAAARAATAPEDEKRVRDLIKDDGVLLARLVAPAVPVEARRKDAERELDEAIRAYEREKDPLHAAWATAIKARLLSWSGEIETARELARPLLDPKQQPAFVRQRAIEAMHRAAVVEKDLEEETRYALELNQLKQAKLTPEARRYARTPMVETTCARFERKHGPGSCALLAFEATGEYSFHDHSRGRPKRSLSPSDVEDSQAQYLPLLRECIASAAKLEESGDVFEDANLTIAWVVDGQGRASGVEISPHRYDDLIGPCVNERVSWFRYPRTLDGERRSVSVPYELKSTIAPRVSR